MGDTNTGLALAYAKEQLFAKEAGARPGVPKVLVWVTDGGSSDPVGPPMQELKDLGATVFIVSTGRGNLLELSAAASAPAEKHLHFVDVDDLHIITPKLRASILGRWEGQGLGAPSWHQEEGRARPEALAGLALSGGAGGGGTQVFSGTGSSASPVAPLPGLRRDRGPGLSRHSCRQAWPVTGRPWSGGLGVGLGAASGGMWPSGEKEEGDSRPEDSATHAPLCVPGPPCLAGVGQGWRAQLAPTGLGPCIPQGRARTATEGCEPDCWKGGQLQRPVAPHHTDFLPEPPDPANPVGGRAGVEGPGHWQGLLQPLRNSSLPETLPESLPMG